MTDTTEYKLDFTLNDIDQMDDKTFQATLNKLDRASFFKDCMDTDNAPTNTDNWTKSPVDEFVAQKGIRVTNNNPVIGDGYNPVKVILPPYPEKDITPPNIQTQPCHRFYSKSAYDRSVLFGISYAAQREIDGEIVLSESDVKIDAAKRDVVAHVTTMYLSQKLIPDYPLHHNLCHIEHSMKVAKISEPDYSGEFGRLLELGRRNAAFVLSPKFSFSSELQHLSTAKLAKAIENADSVNIMSKTFDAASTTPKFFEKTNPQVEAFLQSQAVKIQETAKKNLLEYNPDQPQTVQIAPKSAFSSQGDYDYARILGVTLAAEAGDKPLTPETALTANLTALKLSKEFNVSLTDEQLLARVKGAYRQCDQASKILPKLHQAVQQRTESLRPKNSPQFSQSISRRF